MDFEDLDGAAREVAEPIHVAVCNVTQLFREGLDHVLRSSRFRIASGPRPSGGQHDDAGLVIFGLGMGADVWPQVEQLRAARASNPGVRYVAFLEACEADVVRQVAAAGADAVLSRDISGDVLRRALELVMLGQKLFPASVAGAGMEVRAGRAADADGGGTAGGAGQPRLVFSATEQRGDVSLSEREGQILQCLVGGYSNKSIARDLQITEATVKVHVKGLLRKVRARNRTQAAIWGLGHGFGVPRKVANLAEVPAVQRAAG